MPEFFAVPVVGNNPFAVLLRMAAFRPPPQHFKENVVDEGERIFRADRLMIIRPASKLLVQPANQVLLPPCFAASENRIMQIDTQVFDYFSGWFDDKFSLEFAKCPSQHIKSVVNVGNQRFLL